MSQVHAEFLGVTITSHMSGSVNVKSKLTASPPLFTDVGTGWDCPAYGSVSRCFALRCKFVAASTAGRRENAAGRASQREERDYWGQPSGAHPPKHGSLAPQEPKAACAKGEGDANKSLKAGPATKPNDAAC